MVSMTSSSGSAAPFSPPSAALAGSSVSGASASAMRSRSAVASPEEDCWLLCTTELLICWNRNVPSTTTTITEITSVLVTTWRCSERRQMLRVLPAARRTRRRTPPRI